LAANPELGIARRMYRATTTDTLAANPELRVARAWAAQHPQSIGSCVQTGDDGRLAANPELALAHRAAGC